MSDRDDMNGTILVLYTVVAVWLVAVGGLLYVVLS